MSKEHPEIALDSKKRLQSKFMAALAEDFELYGAQAIEIARENDPIGYVRLCSSLMPKEVDIVNPLEGISDEQLEAVVYELKSFIPAESGGVGAGEEKILQNVTSL